MAGLTREQRAQRKADKLAGGAQEVTRQESGLVVMHTDYPAFPGAPTIADVHPNEVDNWKAAGWRVKE